MNRYLEEALDLAAQGLGRVSPNPAVGAVIVRDDVAVGRGFHTWAGVKHAEVIALDEAGERARGATLYVTLEPCSHQGRTPPCTDAIIAAGIKKVVAAMQDPNPQVHGSGFRALQNAGIESETDATYTARATQLNEAFVHYMRTGRPLVIVKAAVTLDGKIGAPDDNQGWITSEPARAHVQTLRHRSDAILTGIILTKLDGTAKGGVVVAISRELNLPIRYVGVGEQLDDLLPFDPTQFVASLFD